MGQELLSEMFLPRPIKAVILCFPYEGFEEKRKEEDQMERQDDLPVIWIKQKVCRSL